MIPMKLLEFNYDNKLYRAHRMQEEVKDNPIQKKSSYQPGPKMYENQKNENRNPKIVADKNQPKPIL